MPDALILFAPEGPRGGHYHLARTDKGRAYCGHIDRHVYTDDRARYALVADTPAARADLAERGLALCRVCERASAARQVPRKRRVDPAPADLAKLRAWQAMSALPRGQRGFDTDIYP